ncbi:hypothetical protein WR25_19043 isoform B [Diploscapter pachys]|uniref:Uncharacterized protein n=1 Tax=Diploscapter pachys TaxID=2018661 RepID=A0A2A2JJQ4_9BILA|nr:hypothetical protein WR25_19043 isoform B [Diploscapter pachys]
MNGSENRRAKSRLDEIQIVEINRNNINQIWSQLTDSLKNADFIAVDLELSGLGIGIHAKNIEQRYKNIREAAISRLAKESSEDLQSFICFFRSVLSFGIAFFKKSKVNEKKRKVKFTSQVFNILTLCGKPFVMEPDALEFLAKHSFDFNRLISSGIRYMPHTTDETCKMRSLVHSIFSKPVPLCLHNGFIDIVFIYHHFYSPLPESFQEFCNSAAELFTADFPVVDSKYLAESKTRMTASFLEYVFRKCQGDNVREEMQSKVYLQIEFTELETKALRKASELMDCRLPGDFPNHKIPTDLGTQLCKKFAVKLGYRFLDYCLFFQNHGVCHLERQGKCALLHDVDYALDFESKHSSKRRKAEKRRHSFAFPEGQHPAEGDVSDSSETNTADEEFSVREVDSKPRLAVAGSHRAGIDAFMTGYAVLFQERMSIFRTGNIDSESLNRLPLSGKSDPLIFRKPFCNPEVCKIHKERFFTIQQARKKTGTIS